MTNKSFSLFTAAILFFQFFCLHSQEKPLVSLSLENSSFTQVISGKALCEPKRTSYGFVVLSDGKMISACSENGKKLWEKAVPGHPEPYLSVVSRDFLLSVSDKKNLSLINPSGLTLWTVKVPFVITECPVSGRDFRIFVKGKKNVACYGMNGIMKWKADTPSLGNLPLSFLDDGTIVVFLEDSSDGKTVGLRISPFGEILESITFAGLANDVLSVQDGILLVFSGGGTGLCSVADGKTLTKWAISHRDEVFSNANVNKGGIFLSVSEDKTMLLYPSSKGLLAFTISNRNGKILYSFNINEIDFNSISCMKSLASSDGFFISDRKNAFLYKIDGKRIWGGKLPSDKSGNWNYLSYTEGNHILLCGTSWLLTAYRTIQSPSSKKKDYRQKRDYKNFYNIDESYFNVYSFEDSIPEEFTGNGRIKELRSGNYGSKEIKWMSAFYTVLDSYSSFLSTNYSGGRIEKKSVFETDRQSIEQLVHQISLVGTGEESYFLSKLISLENNDSILCALFKSCSVCGFDSDGKLLASIDRKLSVLPVSKTSVLLDLCDGVYEICRFMGRPALYESGMEIMKKLLFPQYDSLVREKARKTLSKIAELNI